ncbi:MAG: MFS transporter, partial [Arenicellales bacterium]
MIKKYRRRELPFKEFITLMALVMSLAALSIDAMLPALAQMGEALGLSAAEGNQGDAQLVVSMLFLGMGLGQLFFGPASDAVGRRPMMLVGLIIFLLGALVSIFSEQFNTMLFGRFLQGLGLGAPRLISTVMVRDLYEGRAMARVMSFIMSIFILMPMIAPILGQSILHFSGWRMIFITIFAIGVVSFLWFLIRQDETMLAQKRRPFSWAKAGADLGIILFNPVVMVYTFISG